MQIKITVNGTNNTDLALMDSIRIESVITKRIDTCAVTFVDRQGTLSLEEWDEIIISDSTGSTRYFAGFISHIERARIGITKAYKCRCQDYTVLLDRMLVNEVFENKTDAEILSSLFSEYLSEIDATTYVATGKTHDRIVFNRCTLREAVDTLSRESGLDWYVDYNKNLHYFTEETNLASFGLSDAPDNSSTYPYSHLKYQRDATQIINRVTVIGGYYLSDDTDFELPGNGQTTEINLPYVFEPPDGYDTIRVYHNTGDDATPTWAEDSVGIDHVDTLGAGGITVLHNKNEKLLKFQTAPPDLKRAVKVTAQYQVPVLIRARSEESYNTYGRWFDGKIVNQDINSRDWAKLEGKAVLADKAFVRETGSLRITQDGLSSGQLVHIKNTLYGLDDDYLIHKVTMRILGKDVWEYTISFGEYNPDLVDLIIAVKAGAKQYYAKREDEVLNELFEQAESLSLTESTDRHEDDFTGGIVNRWIALPPTQSVGHNVEHEQLDLTETPDMSDTDATGYVWGDTTDNLASFPYTFPFEFYTKEAVWDFFTWA